MRAKKRREEKAEKEHLEEGKVESILSNETQGITPPPFFSSLLVNTESPKLLFLK